MISDEVFFDPRKKAEQESADADKISKEEAEKVANIAMGDMVVGTIVRLTLTPLILMWVWNATLPAIGVATIGYWTALGLYVIARLLFKHDD